MNETGPMPGGDGPSHKRLQIWDLVDMTWVRGLVAVERHRLGFLSLVAPLLDARRGRV